MTQTCYSKKISFWKRVDVPSESTDSIGVARIQLSIPYQSRNKASFSKYSFPRSDVVGHGKVKLTLTHQQYWRGNL